MSNTNWVILYLYPSLPLPSNWANGRRTFVTYLTLSFFIFQFIFFLLNRFFFHPQPPLFLFVSLSFQLSSSIYLKLADFSHLLDTRNLRSFWYSIQIWQFLSLKRKEREGWKNEKLVVRWLIPAKRGKSTWISNREMWNLRKLPWIIRAACH